MPPNVSKLSRGDGEAGDVGCSAMLGVRRIRRICRNLRKDGPCIAFFVPIHLKKYGTDRDVEPCPDPPRAEKILQAVTLNPVINSG